MTPELAGTDVLKLQPTDRDAVFVIATDPEAPEMAALLSPRRLNGAAGATAADLLGLPDDQAKQVELINPEDLTGIGLAAYLTDGMGLNAAAVTQDKSSLNALQGPVVLLRGRVSEGRNQDVVLPRGMSLMGRYEAERSAIGLAPLHSIAASGIGAPAAVPPMGPTPRSRAWIASLVLGIGVLLALVAIGLWLL